MCNKWLNANEIVINLITVFHSMRFIYAWHAWIGKAGDTLSEKLLYDYLRYTELRFFHGFGAGSFSYLYLKKCSVKCTTPYLYIARLVLNLQCIIEYGGMRAWIVRARQCGWWNRRGQVECLHHGVLVSMHTRIALQFQLI